MIILISLSLFLSWYYPFICNISAYGFELILPSYIIVVLFWCAYSFIDVILYFDILRKDLFVFWFNRQKKKDEKLLESFAIKALMCEDDLYKISKKINIKSKKDALLFLQIASKSDHGLLFNLAIGHVKKFFPNDYYPLLILSYANFNRLSFQLASDLFFKDKIPFWFALWSKKMPIWQMASVTIPSDMPHSSWHDWLKRIYVAKILSAENLDNIYSLWNTLPVSWQESGLLRWALLEKSYNTNMPSIIKNLNISDDKLVNIYDKIYFEGADLSESFRILQALNDVSGYKYDSSILADLDIFDISLKPSGEEASILYKHILKKALLEVSGLV